MAKDAISRYEIAPEDTSAPAVASPVAPGGDAISRYEIAPDAPPSAAATLGGWGDTISNALGYGAGLVGSFTHGLSFGLDRPVNALIASTFPNTAFARMQAENAQSQKDFDAAHPVVSTLAQAAGTVPGYAAGEGALAGSVLPPIARGGVVGTVGSAATSAARNALVNSTISAGMADGDLNDRIAAARQGAIVGGVAGPVGDIVGGAVGKGVSAVTGGAGGASAADAALGNLAVTKYKIPITAPDLSSNSLYRIGNDQLSKLPFSGAAAAATAKHEAWQKAIATEMGEPNTKAFTSDVMDRAKTRIGQEFDRVAANTSIPPPETITMTRDLNAIEANARLTLPDSELTPLTKQLENIQDIINKGNGTISGAQYQALTRAKAPLDLAESSADPNVRHFAGQIRDALDDAFVRSATPADQAALTQAKYQYRIMRTIDPLVAGSRDGNITPDAFMQKVVTASRRFDSPTGGIAYTGGGNIGELAKIGKLMRAPPQTGSADRAAINFGALLATGGPAAVNPSYALGVPSLLAANNVAQRYLNSPFLANRVVNSSLNPQAAQRYAPYVVPLANALASGKVPIQ